MRTSIHSALLAVTALAIAASCDAPPAEGEGEGEGEACALDATARELLLHSVNELWLATAWSTANTHGDEGFIDLAFAATLPGLDVDVLQHASFVVPCTEASTFVPTCESTVSPVPPEGAFFDDHDRCFRLGCAGAGQPRVDVYFTMKPLTDADQRHTFVTTTTSPIGTSTYAENPLIRWVADLTTPGTVDVHADVDIAHTFTGGADPLDVSMTGTAAGTSVTSGETSEVTLDVALSFPALAPGPILVEAHADEEGLLTGAIILDAGTASATTLATLGGALDLDAPLPFAWIEACD